MSTKPPLWTREPLAFVLIVENILLVAALVYWNLSSPRAAAAPEGLPPGHPDFASSAPLLAPAGPGADAALIGPAVAASPSGEGIPSMFVEMSGTVKLSPKLAAKWPDGAHVFVIARGENGGPPFAVRRYDGVKPPFAWALGPENVMIAGATAPEKLRVIARADQDGDAMTRQPGDLESAPTKAVRVAGGKADILIDRPTTPNVGAAGAP
jgi:hypothetical protein